MCCDSPNLGLVVPTMSLGGHGTANMTGNIAPAELATISTPWTSYAEAENFKTRICGCCRSCTSPIRRSIRSR